MKINIKEIFKKLFKDNGVSYGIMTKKMGRNSTSFLSQPCSRKSIMLNLFLEICNTLDYEMVIRPKYGENKRERSINITEYIER